MPGRNASSGSISRLRPRFTDRAPRHVRPLRPTLRPLRLCGAPLPSLQISRKANKNLIGTPND